MCVTFLLQPLLRSMKVWTSQEPLWRRKMKGRRKNRSFSRLLYIITLGESHCSPKTWVWAENALSDFICRSDDCKYWILLMYVCTFSIFCFIQKITMSYIINFTTHYKYQGFFLLNNDFIHNFMLCVMYML